MVKDQVIYVLAQHLMLHWTFSEAIDDRFRPNTVPCGTSVSTALGSEATTSQ